MSLKRVGKEISAEEYWKERSLSYKSNLNGPYHLHRLAMVMRLFETLRIKGSVCVDFGCGEGVFLEVLVRNGAMGIGIDPSQELVAVAEDRLRMAGLTAKVWKGGVELLKKIETESVDYVLALNVLAYFRDEEEDLFYRDAARVLKTNGSLIVTHSNRLFDIYTLNAYTVNFFETELCGAGSGQGISSLLVYPDKPERVTFNVRENPLTYRYKLEAYGFEESQQEFANFHPRPPLLMNQKGFIDIDKRGYVDTLDWEESEKWKLMFMCSMFGSRSEKR